MITRKARRVSSVFSLLPFCRRCSVLGGSFHPVAQSNAGFLENSFKHWLTFYVIGDGKICGRWKNKASRRGKGKGKLAISPREAMLFSPPWRGWKEALNWCGCGSLSWPCVLFGSLSHSCALFGSRSWPCALMGQQKGREWASVALGWLSAVIYMVELEIQPIFVPTCRRCSR